MSDIKFPLFHAMTLACDLSETTLIEAIAMPVTLRDTPRVLVASLYYGDSVLQLPHADKIRQLAEKFQILPAVLPLPMLTDADGWALVGERNVIWTPGA